MMILGGHLCSSGWDDNGMIEASLALLHGKVLPPYTENPFWQNHGGMIMGWESGSFRCVSTVHGMIMGWC